MDFRTDGIPVGLKYAYKKGTNISSAADVIAAPNSDQAIVITDLVISKLTAGTMTLQDDTTAIAVLYPAAKSISSINFSGPLMITAGNAFKAMLDDGDTDYSILATYYIK
jgi:hypothetical protein